MFIKKKSVLIKINFYSIFNLYLMYTQIKTLYYHVLIKTQKIL